MMNYEKEVRCKDCLHSKRPLWGWWKGIVCHYDSHMPQVISRADDKLSCRQFLNKREWSK